MRNGTYKLSNVYRDVAMQLKASGDSSPAKIRCAINDHLDSWDKSGFKVNFDYNQPKAVKTVQRLTREL